MKISSISFCLALTSVVLSICGFKTPVISKTTKTIFNDSAVFEPNTSTGWTIYSYYFHKDTADSVDFEIILKHASDIQYWTNEQYSGTIKGSFIPATEQVLRYYLLLNNLWSLRIAKDGKCYLNVVTGHVPAGNTVVIPIKVEYKMD